MPICVCIYMHICRYINLYKVIVLLLHETGISNDFICVLYHDNVPFYVFVLFMYIYMYYVRNDVNKDDQSNHIKTVPRVCCLVVILVNFYA